MIGRGWDEQIGILSVAHEIARTGIGAAVPGAPGLRDGLTGLGVRNCRRREEASGSGRCQHVTARDGIHEVLPDVLCLTTWRPFVRAYADSIAQLARQRPDVSNIRSSGCK